MEKTRAGIQSVEVGSGLLDVLARATGLLMLRDLGPAALTLGLASLSRILDVRWDGAVAQALRVAAWRLSNDLGHSHPPTRSSLP